MNSTSSVHFAIKSTARDFPSRLSLHNNGDTKVVDLWQVYRQSS